MATTSFTQERALNRCMASTASGGRRRGPRRNLSWGTLFCFGGQEGGTTPWAWESARRRKKRRTVPVDGDLVGTEVMRRGSESDEEESRSRSRSGKRKALRLPGCCFFFPPARPPGRERSAVDGSSGRNKQRHPERTEPPPPPRWSQSDTNSPSGASRIEATGGSNGSRSRGAEQSSRSAPPAETTGTTPAKPSEAGAGGVGAFGPVVGLSVVVAVSMAGLLGGRLWAVACVCAWLAALSRLRLTRTRTAAGDGADQAAVDVDSTNHKEQPERDRRKAVVAAA